MGADLVGSIFAKIGKVVGVHDVIIHSTFGLNFFRGFRSTAGQSIRFSIDFAGHRYNSAAATAHPVIMIRAFLFFVFGCFKYRNDVSPIHTMPHYIRIHIQNCPVMRV